MSSKFISYAQNCEDVLLYRVLGDIKDGFYVDVGAHDPLVGSVTKAFYDRGWRGLNIEPGPRFEALKNARPRDININCAVGVSAKSKFYETSSGLSTQSTMIAMEHADKGFKFVESEINVRPLSEILDGEKVGDIHFLKVDTEGAEKDVLLSNNFSRYRPWVTVVEATYPLSKIQTHHEWEHILTSNGYKFVWFDGLNRWYLADEKYEMLKAGFDSPPNFFDNYVPYREYFLQEVLTRINAMSANDSTNTYRHLTF